MISKLPANTPMFKVMPDELLKKWTELGEGEKLKVSHDEKVKIVDPKKKCKIIEKHMEFFGEQIQYRGGEVNSSLESIDL